jgi:DHA1 family arabinose polymer transporter-like MFS transporter
MKKSLIALALGTLALGITEYVMMAILPEVASSLGVSIPEAGHLISAYALGVSAGAPLLVFAYKFKPKNILLFLAGIMLLGAIISVLSPNYWVFLVARFISGLPHGAYFGVASIVAVQLADENHKSSAVSVMIAGMTIANLLGVPLASSLCALLSWRFPFVLTIFCSLLVIYYIWKWIPDIDRLPNQGFKGQFKFLKNKEPWLVLAATMLGNGGIFCWYSYVSPLLNQEGGFGLQMIPMLMVIAGFGMVIGNLASGRLSDKYKPERVALCTQLLAAIALVGIFFLAQYGWISVVLMVICTACLFAVSGPEQFLILKHSKGGEMLGGASVQMAFNLGNALGALLGGIPISAGFSPRYAAMTGIPLCLMGFICLGILYQGYRSTDSDM